MPSVNNNAPGRFVTRLCMGVATACVLVAPVSQAAGLKKIEGCTLVPADWADGDSFRVQIPAKPAQGDKPGWKARQITVRLYGADCIESKVRDDSDARRLRAQRRYFGITEVGGKPQESIRLAKEFGAKATAETRKLLGKPFTIHTTFADARGSAKFKRYYAFVRTADGKDLASELVARGLARAYGVYRATPDGTHRDDYKAHLADLELKAARNGAGVWRHTDWEKLPKQRQDQRDDDRDLEIAKGKLAPPAKKIPVNKAAKDELMRIPGIGDVMADRIIGGRPYQKPVDLLKVPGVGPKTLEKLKPFLDFPAG